MLSLPLCVHPSHPCFFWVGIFVPGTSAEAMFASSQEVLVSRMSDSLLASGTELGCMPAPERMNGLIS